MKAAAPHRCDRCYQPDASILIGALAVDGRKRTVLLHEACLRAMARDLGDRAPELAGVVEMLDRAAREDGDV